MKVAVIGSGCAGLAATWALNEHSDHEVDLFEVEDRPGGHANTVAFEKPGNAEAVDVDTGFIVLNPTTYPNFLRFLKLKNVKILPTEMTFSVSRNRGLFEWAGKNLFTVFCQPSRLLDSRMWALIYDVLRFNACARWLLQASEKQQVNKLSIGQYLHENNYSSYFIDNYLIPMTAAIWSTPPEKCALDFPAQTLIQFMHNHHLLQITGKPSWLTIKGGSKVYVNKVISALNKERLHLSTRVTSVRSSEAGVQLQTADGTTRTFDHVIIACHSDTALQILRSGNITPDEERILGRFDWNKNEAVLHYDKQLMPKSRLAWSCWNYLSSSERNGNGKHSSTVSEVALTYWMNDLQHIPEKKYGPIFVTLNPPFEPKKDTIIGRWKYEHPILDAKAVEAQAEIHKIQYVLGRNISFAGAYLRFGFHEDGFTSGIRVAERLGASLPFQILDPDREITYMPLAKAFDAFEYLGFRIVIGSIFSWILYFVRIPLGMLVGLSYLENE